MRVRRNRKRAPYNLERKEAEVIPTEGLPLFRGRTMGSSGPRGYTFIDKQSIDHISGPELALEGDMLIHLNENRSLPNPIPAGAWVYFFVRISKKSRTGIQVVGAMLEKTILAKS